MLLTVLSTGFSGKVRVASVTGASAGEYLRIGTMTVGTVRVSCSSYDS